MTKKEIKRKKKLQVYQATIPAINKVLEKNEHFIKAYWKAVSECWKRGYNERRDAEILAKHGLGEWRMSHDKNIVMNWDYDLTKANNTYKKLVRAKI